MSAPLTIRRVTPDHPFWFGMLCAENAEAITEHLNRMLDGKFYAFVAANSYSTEHARFSAVDVATSRRLEEPITLTPRSEGHDWIHISAHDTYGCWGLTTGAVTERDARSGKNIHDHVHLAFDRRYGSERLTIEHYAPAGYRLQWTIVVEDHRDGAS